MARIRSIHPGLFSDPEFAALSDAAQVFYLGLLTEADDNGVFEWKPGTLRIRLRPGKDGKTEPLLSELVDAEKITHFEVDGRKYGAIRNFRRYQRPKAPKGWHPIPDNLRNYVGLSGPTSEIGGDQSRSVPTNGENDDDQRSAFPGNGEIAPQMEDEGEDLTTGKMIPEGISNRGRGSGPARKPRRAAVARPNGGTGPPPAGKHRTYSPRAAEPDWEAWPDDR